MKNVFIYTLCDPRRSEVRYVGRTLSPINRLSGHISKARKNPLYASSSWIKSLLEDDVRPVMTVLEGVPPGVSWQERESHWIKYYRTLGARLLNHTDGGDGISGASVETRRKISVATKGRIPSYETRQRMSESGRGKKKPEWFRQMVIDRNTGRVHSVETKEKIGRAHRGKTVSQEARDKMSLTRKGRAVSIDTREKMKAIRAMQERERKSACIAAKESGLTMEEMVSAGFSFRAIGRVFGMCHHSVKSKVTA